ncbi:F0F1 ATP synthase subunit A [Pontiella sp.]|uniref:F0F1 ATP synthase subunit A n=1 Tax=Pontiella sp. TaxID=2837462 RepID=UPI00356904E0
MSGTSSNKQLGHGIQPAGRWMRLLAAIFLFGLSHLCHSAEHPAGEPTAIEHVAPEGTAHEAAAEEHEAHLSPFAPEIFSIGGMPVTNSMITGWLAAIVLISISIRFQLQVRADRNTRFTAAVEALVVALHGFLAEIMGEKLAKKTFWLLGSFFVFILCSNLLGLFPGIGSVGWGQEGEHHFAVTTPLFRGVNADLNTTLALGALFFFFWFIWAWKANGPVGLLKHIFGFSGEAAGVMRVAMVIVFIAVGFLEVLSIVIRPFSLALRLYGNIFAGEVVLDTMLHKVPLLSWLLPVPFYMMEVLVGLIQALVFTLLSAVFVMLICSHDEKEPHSETKPDAS